MAYNLLIDSFFRRLPVVVGVGPVGAGELASSNHLVTYTVDVVEQVVLNATHSGNSINNVQEDLDLGVAAWRVELANELATPCNVDEHVSASESLAANGRVCIKVNATKEDADDYVAFIESATLTNNDKGVSTVLVAGRSHGSSSTDEAYAGAFFNDAHLDGDLTDDYVDYLTFFIDPELQAEPLFADASVDIGATFNFLKGATIEADPVEEDQETSADSDAEPKTAGLPIVAAIVAGASLLGAATGAYIVSKYREAYQTERIAPEVFPVKDVDLETPPATLPANPALFVRR